MSSQVYFPAVNFRISAVVVSTSAVSPIEDHVLQAILAGVETLDALTGLLGLPLRFAMEILNRMLRRNLVMVDFRTGRFGIPRSIQEAMMSASEPIPSGPEKSQITEYQLCLNRCTGTISRRRYLRMIAPECPALSYQPERSYDITDLDEIRVERTISQLVAAAGLHVRDVNLASARPEVDGGLIAEASCLEWDDGGASVTLQFDGRQNVPPQEVSELEAMVLTMRSERPWWWRRLGPRRSGKEASVVAQRCIPQGLGSLAAPFERRGDELSRDWAIQTLQRLAEVTRSSVIVEPVIGPAHVVREVQQLVRGAREQIVLVCPFLTEAGLQSVLPYLEDPKRVAKTFVIHGIDDAVDAAAGAPSSRIAGLSHVVLDLDHGSKAHAKIAIQDANSALVTTMNYLSSGGASPLFDVGVTLHGGGAVIDDLLLWASSVAAPAVAKKGAWRANDFVGARTSASSHSLPMLDVPGTFAALVEEVAGRLHGSGDRVDCRVFTQSVLVATEHALRSPDGDTKLLIQASEIATFIQRVVDDLEASHRASVEVVSTTSHRAFLFDALERAKDSVLVASHHIGRPSLGPNFRKTLRRALDRGVTVVLLWGEHSVQPRADARPGVPDPGDALISQLIADVEGTSGRLVVNRMPLGIHCKLLVLDRAATLVTSYDLLDFIDSHEYNRNELGLWIDSTRVASAMLGGLRDHIRGVHPEFARTLDGCLT